MDIRQVRQLIFARDGHKCCNCGSTEILQLDHVLPKSLFHIHTVDNIQTLCLRCNFKKGAHSLSEERYFIIEEYLLKANRELFSATMISEMNQVLEEYFKHREKRHAKGNPRIVTLERYEAFTEARKTEDDIRRDVNLMNAL
jgi:hypothetical protein